MPADATASPITPFVTPNGDFYRIDTALSFPRISLSKWKVDITGMVDTPLSLSYDDLLARPQVERIVTLTCVSNEVGGEYISNAVWQGVTLADLLKEAGVRSGAEQVFSTSLDGWTSGFPIAAALDGRDAMIALGVNGEALPLEHGFPARLRGWARRLRPTRSRRSNRLPHPLRQGCLSSAAARGWAITEDITEVNAKDVRPDR